VCRNESRELISQLRSIPNFDCDLYYLSPLTTTSPLLSGNIGRWRHDRWTLTPNIQSVVLHREVNPFHFTSIDTFVAGIQRSCVNLHDRACNSKCSITCRCHLSFQFKSTARRRQRHPSDITTGVLATFIFFAFSNAG
jgi:hypothetical protein